MAERLRQATKPTERPTTFVRLRGMRCFPEIYRLICEGMQVSEVARRIQEDNGEYTEVARDSLETILREYRASLSPGELVQVFPSVFSEATKRLDNGLSEVEETKRLYEMQVERLEWMRELEKTLKFPVRGMPAEFQIAAQLLMNSSQLKQGLGLGNGGIGLQVDVRLLAARHGENVANVLSQPDSARRVISLVERLQALKRRGLQEDSVLEEKVG